MFDTATALATTRTSWTRSVLGQNLKRITALCLVSAGDVFLVFGSTAFFFQRSFRLSPTLLSQFRVHRENVPASPYRFNIARIFRVRLDFLAQPADMVIDRAVEQVGVAALGQIQQLVAGQCDLGPFQQGGEQAKFAAGQR